MKRNYEFFNANNIPDYILELSNAIINKNNSFNIILSNDDADGLETDDIENYLNIVLNNNSRFHSITENISFIYKINEIEYQIQLLYNSIKDIYRISCIIY